MPAKFFLFDCETTGTSAKKHTLLTIYGLALNEDLSVVDTIDLKIKPNDGIYHVSPEAMKINNIDLAEHDKVAILEEEAARIISNFLYSSKYKMRGLPPKKTELFIPVGKNIEFDIKFLQKLMGKDEYKLLFSHRILDISSIVHFQKLCGLLPIDLKESLEDLAKFFGISTKGLHNAEVDAITAKEVLKYLIENNKKGNYEIQPKN